jgi:peptidoglycan pentaglycine glycine transferase (the first glycine)
MTLGTRERASEDQAGSGSTAANAGYQMWVSDECESPEWDAFLRETPGGHYVQTSLWAQVKATLGWRAVRIVVRQDERIVAGAQLLVRPVAASMAVGYVPRGPLIAVADPRLTELVLYELLQIAKECRVQYLSVQPPCNGQALARDLANWGFVASLREVEPTATTILDLRKELIQLLRDMKLRTRYNVRLSERKGIKTREGTSADISTFYQLLRSTALRHRFSTHDEHYFLKLWQVLEPRGHAKLFLAEYDGEAVCGLFTVTFAKTVYCWRAAWSGRYGNRRPNEAVHWAAISWSKSIGYQFYDFEGIDPRVARALVQGNGVEGSPDPDGLEKSPASPTSETVSSFKLGFGGRIELSPGAYDYVPNPLLRGAYRAVAPRIMDGPLLEKVEDLVRGIGRG